MKTTLLLFLVPFAALSQGHPASVPAAMFPPGFTPGVVSINPAVVVGPVGRTVLPVNVEIAWNDAGASNANVTSYDIWYGTGALYKSPPMLVTKWASTNGVDYFTLTNIFPPFIYHASMIAMSSNGQPVFLTNAFTNITSYEIAFMAPRYLLSGFDGTNPTVSFWCASNHAYTVQARGLSETNWSNLYSFSNGQGVITYTDRRPMGKSQLYRLAISP